MENPLFIIYSVIAIIVDTSVATEFSTHTFGEANPAANGGDMNPEKEINEEKLSEQLQRLLKSIEVSGRAVLPGSSDALLKSIVETAARIFGAAAASILLVNEEEEALEFRVSTGEADHDLVGTKFPYDKGIAGYVFMTGLPIATSNVKEDKRFNQDFA